MNPNLYKLPNQEIEKSVIYEIPREQGSRASGYGRYEPASFNKIKYKVKEDLDVKKRAD